MMVLQRIVAVALLTAALWDVLHGHDTSHTEPHPLRVVRYVSEQYMPKAEVVRLAPTTR
jgi:hypothetical protein